MALQIVELIFMKYFTSKKMKGHKHDDSGVDFQSRINKEFICLVCTVLRHHLKSYEKGYWVNPGEFNRSNCDRKDLYPLYKASR